jgi:hypothetical protein
VTNVKLGMAEIVKADVPNVPCLSGITPQQKVRFALTKNALMGKE